MLVIAHTATAQRSYFSGGYSYSVFICNTKNVLSWGDNYYGQLARSTSEGAYNIPSQIPSVSNIVSIDAGLGSFCCALTSEGYVLTWGHNIDGELGTGETCPSVCKKNEADTVLGGETGSKFLENVVAIATGQMHAYALLESGEVVAWGNNTYGQLGDGSTESTNVPIYVKANASERLSGIQKIAAGGNHGYALTQDGHVYAWGDNQANQLGCGDADTHLYPTYVVDVNGNKISSISDIDGGMFFGLMLRSNSMVYGTGAYKGTHVDKTGIYYKTYPYAEFITAGETSGYYLENVTAISAGFSHALAIVSNNGEQNVVAWGDNRFETLQQESGGQLGIGYSDNTQSFSPAYMRTSASQKISNALKINAGCGVSIIETYNSNTSENQIYICGSNSDGQLGFGDYIDRYYANLMQNICTPYCGAFSFGANKTLCAPIQYELETPFPETSFDFVWYKDNEKCDVSTASMTITSVGDYTVAISDKTGDCPDMEASIHITEQEPDFQIIQSSYCSSKLTFKVVGDGEFNWYSAMDGYLLGSGKAISTSPYFCEEIKTDSIYQIWVEHVNSCQPLPMQTIKKCDCAVTPPESDDAEFCYNRENYLTAVGDSILWYDDSLCFAPLTMNDTLYTNYTDDSTYTLYVTQIKDRCESAPSTPQLTLIYCDPWYEITGIVEDGNGNPAAYALVYLYTDETTIADSCTADEYGYFRLITHECTGKILAQSPSETYYDTWAGQSLLKQFAYEFIVDADIKYVQIHLIPVQSSIRDIPLDELLADAESVMIVSLQGQVLDILSVPTFMSKPRETYAKPYLIVIKRHDGTSTSIYEP